MNPHDEILDEDEMLQAIDLFQLGGSRDIVRLFLALLGDLSSEDSEQVRLRMNSGARLELRLTVDKISSHCELLIVDAPDRRDFVLAVRAIQCAAVQ